MRPRVTSVGLIVPPPPAEPYSPPAHIDRASLDALPTTAGVYLFLDRSGKPVYIGKSVNIRARVHAHLRTAEEAGMLAEAAWVEFRRTAGEIGALLLESQLIKEHQPAYNILLKYAAESYALCLDEDASCLTVVAASEACSDVRHTLSGLFPSRSAAQEGLEFLVRHNRLCPGLLGLESISRGRACFAYQIGRCRGACIGKESRQDHASRVRATLQRLDAEVWPYAGPIGIIERQRQWRQVHVVDRWTYIGTLEGRRRQLRLPDWRAADIDTYKILTGPLAQGKLAVAMCEVRQNKTGTRSCFLRH